MILNSAALAASEAKQELRRITGSQREPRISVRALGRAVGKVDDRLSEPAGFKPGKEFVGE